MGYTVAAYVVVLGSLLAYGLWLARQRRALSREELALAERAGQPTARGPATADEPT